MASPRGIATKEGFERLNLVKDGRPPRGEVKSRGIATNEGIERLSLVKHRRHETARLNDDANRLIV